MNLNLPKIKSLPPLVYTNVGQLQGTTPNPLWISRCNDFYGWYLQFSKNQMPQLWYIIMVIKKSNTQSLYIIVVFNFLKESNLPKKSSSSFLLVLSWNLLGFWGFWNYNQNSLFFYSFFSNTQTFFVFFFKCWKPMVLWFFLFIHLYLDLVIIKKPKNYPTLGHTNVGWL